MRRAVIISMEYLSLEKVLLGFIHLNKLVIIRTLLQPPLYLSSDHFLEVQSQSLIEFHIMVRSSLYFKCLVRYLKQK